MTAATVKHMVGGVSAKAPALATTLLRLTPTAVRCLTPTAVPLEGTRAAPRGGEEWLEPKSET
eukprot:1912601-Pyramimonas_sp.AAC.1